MINEGYTIDFFPMNTFYLGNDDREYYKKIEIKLKDYKQSINFYKNEYTLDETVNIFKEHSFVIGMRFHSVVFGNTLGIPTLAIDYDISKGKVYGFMNEIGLEENYVSINDIISSDILIRKLENFDVNKTSDILSSFNIYAKTIIDVPCQDIFNKESKHTKR